MEGIARIWRAAASCAVGGSADLLAEAVVRQDGDDLVVQLVDAWAIHSADDVFADVIDAWREAAPTGSSLRFVLDEARAEALAAAREAKAKADAESAAFKAADFPARLRGFTFARARVMDAGADWNAWRLEILRASVSREPVVGITEWNGVAARALRDWTPVDGWIGCFGPVGTGKSTLVGCAVGDQIRAGVRTIWLTEARLFDAVIADRATFARLRRADVVVVDDFGSPDRPKPWQVEIVERLVVEAYDDRRAIVVTSNTPIEAAKGRRSMRTIYGDRIADRFAERLAAHVVGGPSWRSA